MKICYIGSANSIHLQKWAIWFVKRGYEIHLISESSEDIDGVEVHQIGKNKKGSFLNFINKLFETKKLIKEIKPDILHAHYAFGYGTFAAFSNYHPFILSPWGSDILISPKKSIIIKFLVRYALKKADLITCDGENTIKEMIHLGANPGKINKIYHGIDINKFNPDKKDEKLRKRLRIEKETPVIISTRSLNPIYDIETTIRSVPLVLNKFPKAKFIIVGSAALGKLEKKDYPNYLREVVKKLKITDSIKFVGRISNDEIMHYLNLADIYVSTSLSDGGIALSTLEAMACETVPIVTDVANNRKWIKDKENGFIVPVKDPETLAEKIIYLLRNGTARKEFGKIGRKIVEAKQNYDKEMKKMNRLYINLLKSYKDKPKKTESKDVEKIK